MKTLLTITVLVSSLLSIFSSSLKLYEVPEVKEVVSIINEERQFEESNSEIKRIYISHDVSENHQNNSSQVLHVKKKQHTPSSAENHINVFGVKISNKNS